MDTRIGYPNEHLAGDSDAEITSPLYATAVGLVMDGLKRSQRRQKEYEEEKALEETTTEQQTEANNPEFQNTQQNDIKESQVKTSKSLFDRLSDKVKNFLDNAE
jgi:cell division protein FtsA